MSSLIPLFAKSFGNHHTGVAVKLRWRIRSLKDGRGLLLNIVSFPLLAKVVFAMFSLTSNVLQQQL